MTPLPTTQRLYKMSSLWDVNQTKTASFVSSHTHHTDRSHTQAKQPRIEKDKRERAFDCAKEQNRCFGLIGSIRE